MIIHVIESGETAFTIADEYGVSAEWLIRANGIQYPNDIAVGGTLVILYPSITHTVIEGDTLESIANLYGTTVMDLLRNNSYLSDQEYLRVGEVIVIEYEDERVGDLTVFGYCFSFIEESILRKTLPYLTYIIIYSYIIQEDGQIQELDDEIIIEYAKTYGVAPVMIISFDERAEVSPTDIFHLILNDERLSNGLIENIVSVLSDKGYSGMSITPSYIYPSDRQLYVDFLEELIGRVKAIGLKVFDTIIPNTFELITDIFGTQPYIEFINRLVDSSIIFPHSVGIALGIPIGSLNQRSVESFIEYFLEYIPPEMIQLGISTVGYLWELPYEAYISEGNSIAIYSAISMARDFDIPIQYDEGTNSAFFIYQENNTEILVRFPDARSFEAFLEMVDKYNLDGIGVWNIMSFTNILWLVVNSQYYINKVDL